ncbi:MAG: pyridoxal phosphate-dependent aminotransferase [Vicingaceae bacterium]
MIDFTFHSKLPKVGTTIFTVMSALANEQKAINLSQGFPDFPIDEQLAELVANALKQGYNQYAPMAGILNLRETLAKKIEKLYGYQYHPETEITITAGATQAIFTFISAFINEGDEVIVFTPAYDCYEPAIELNQGKTVFVPTYAPDYKIDWENVKKLINAKTKMIIINTPHNPTGTIFSREDLLKLESMIKNTDILVLSDEVYEHIIFDNESHQSVAKFPGLAERSLIVSSFGKTFHATGWKIGYCVAPKELMAEFRKVHQFNVFCVNHPMQVALNDYLKNEQHYLNLGAFYQEKRDYFLALIKDSRFTFKPSKGTYFQLLNYGQISNEKDVDFAVRLTKENKIASIPVSVFYNKKIEDNMLRFCFAKNKETLEKAAEILCKI